MRARQISSLTLPLVLVAAVVLAVGCGQRQTVVQADKARYPEAIQVYLSGCVTCHGNNLEGGIGPSLQHIGSTMTLHEIVHRIEVGAGPMPAYYAPGDSILSKEQILAVAKWLETKQ